VAQRLKRLPTILDKLTRIPTMSVTTMHDLGGCRVVFETVDEVEELVPCAARAAAGAEPRHARVRLPPRRPGAEGLRLPRHTPRLRVRRLQAGVSRPTDRAPGPYPASARVGDRDRDDGPVLGE
jgi:hypothetical protein